VAVLIRHGEVRRPRIGVVARSEELSNAERAVRILGVEAGAPAGRAGLRQGDLLLRANGSPLYTLDDLQRALVLSDGQVSLELRRGEEVRLVPIEPERKRAA
jgi:S1-C subfamily serine protease